jgi:hypothetical protein
MKKMYHYINLMFVAMLTSVTLSCSSNDEDGYIASTLRNSDWQGKITEYYQSRWGISGSEYSTVMGFESKDAYYTSGKGYELDYKTSSPQENYAFCTFKWFIVDGDITIIYDDAKWNPVYIVDYELRGNSFYGYIYNGSDRRIQFDLEKTTFTDWDYYRKKGYRDLNVEYHAPQLNDKDAISVAKGEFAKILKSKD